MAFNQEELQIIEYAKKNNKTRAETEKALIKYRESKNVSTQPANDKPGYISRVGSEISGAYKDLQKTTERGAELMQQGKDVEGAVMSGLGASGSAVRAAFSPITAALSPIISKGLESSGILDKASVQSKLANLDAWAKAHPDAAENLKNIFDVGTAVIGGKAVGAVTPTVSKATRATISAGADMARSTGRAVSTGVEKVAPLATGTGELVSRGISSAAEIPARIKTNVGAMEAETKAIKALPGVTAQNAAKNGIDIADVKSLTKIPVIAKPDVKLLADNIVKFVSGESSIDPIEFVGKPIVARIKTLEKERQAVGVKLGKASKNIGVLTKPELETGVFGALKEVPGFQNLSIKDGVLDFSRTTLASDLGESATSRKAIQDAYTQAVRWGNGEQAHNFRQELFEILDGKKRSLLQMTATDEKALEAIRRGLSNVIETKNPEYKKLSQQYATLSKPLSDIRKKIRAVDPSVSEDILEMNAGMLARRLTSTAISRGEITNLLKQLDTISNKKESILERTLALQDTYNILGKYYDIAPKTGYQGLTRAAIEGTGIVDTLVGGIKKFAGETPAVRQQALQELLGEVLR